MNEIARAPALAPTTQTADGLPRYRWSLDQFERLIELGIFNEQDRIELIDGELIPMSPKGVRHELVRDEIHQWLTDHRPKGVRHSVEIGWRPDDTAYIEPDIIVFPTGFQAATVPPAEVLLIIEVADTSLPFDMGLKAATYARLGVREYWVVNARTLETIVCREPGAEGYRQKITVPASAPLVPDHIAGLSLRLDQLGT